MTPASGGRAGAKTFTVAEITAAVGGTSVTVYRHIRTDRPCLGA
jgi:hypothetical protein